MNDAYREQVAGIIADREAATPCPPPSASNLTIANRRLPVSVGDLLPAEVEQLRFVWQGLDLDDVLSDEENEVEAAEVVDAAGTVRYRLYGWNYGAGYLFPPEGTTPVAAGAQHDMEHWSLAQRDLFAAMDRALKVGGHGFAQPLNFCWSNDACWEGLER
ncbi:hypothetical protein [Dactylosporangium sp. CA-233914]|uniref:hypothetical protein n=1 Tax=Dactylosporangium sp. CA-233914 TaxID=3239934 RepID=UPI003D8B31F8